MHFSNIEDGIPGIDVYRAVVASDAFAAMAAHSDAFLERHKGGMGYYRLRWGKDPLRNWSRQWEYPYVYQRIQEYLQTNVLVAPRILDAGSGVTFLPWLLQESMVDASVSCCDYDARLAGIYESINKAAGRNVAFSRADMAALPYADASFDIVYCISVLEHTRNYPEIIQEFRRVLRPGGRLIVTFDLSLDGMHEISVEGGVKLLDTLGRSFSFSMSHDLHGALAGPTILTTRAAGQLDPALLPWKFPLYSRVRASLRKGAWASWPPLLTVCCMAADRQP